MEDTKLQRSWSSSTWRPSTRASCSCSTLFLDLRRRPRPWSSYPPLNRSDLSMKFSGKWSLEFLYLNTTENNPNPKEQRFFLVLKRRGAGSLSLLISPPGDWIFLRLSGLSRLTVQTALRPISTGLAERPALLPREKASFFSTSQSSALPSNLNWREFQLRKSSLIRTRFLMWWTKSSRSAPRGRILSTWPRGPLSLMLREFISSRIRLFLMFIKSILRNSPRATGWHRPLLSLLGKTLLI